MAHVSQPDKKAGGLRLRIVAALVMAPPVILSIYFGSPFLDILVLAGLALLASEWARLCQKQEVGPALWALVAVCVAALLAARFLQPLHGLAVMLLGGGGAAFLASRAQGSPILMFVGALYLPVACFSLLWLRDQPLGVALTLWVMLSVWATDSGAYAAGKLIGGPKLLPRISPNKTWAGLAGGMAAAAIVGLAFSMMVPEWRAGPLMAMGAALAVIAQAGDFFESGIKRHFDQKDSGNIIPGHGGLFDRVDGLLTASLAAAIFILLGRGGGIDWL